MTEPQMVAVSVDKPAGRTRTRMIRLGLAVVPLLLLAALGEIAVRVHRGRLLSTTSTRRETLWNLRSAYPAIYDPLLGYVPKPGFQGKVDIWDTRVTIDEAGLRSNGRPRGSGPSILAVGDSYTFGDEVNDYETWPAQLEVILGRPVLNGGVFGYGMDQMVLRAERLLDQQPGIDTVVVSVIPDDVLRCDFSYRFAWKPYFDIVDAKLVLRNVPVPHGRAKENRLLTVLGHSHLADSILLRVAPGLWLTGPFDVRRAHQDGPRVGALLAERLLEKTRSRNIRVVLVIQGHPGHEAKPLEALIRRSREMNLEVLDLLSTMKQLTAAQPDLLPKFYSKGLWGIWGHMTAAGNAWIARRIADELITDSIVVP